MSPLPGGGRWRRIALLLVLGAGAGCAARARDPLPQSAGVTAERPTLAMLPLEDLSGKAGVADKLGRIVFTALVQDGRWSVIEPGEVDGAMARARVRSTGMMTRDQIGALAHELGTPWLVAGAALEYGSVRTPDGDVPTVGLALRLIDGRTGRVVWADQRYVSGEDKETVFGWARQTMGERVAQQAAEALVHGITIHTPAPDSTAAPGGTP